MRAEIDEAAWSALYSTTSYPFEKPETGKIGVNVWQAKTLFRDLRVRLLN